MTTTETEKRRELQLMLLRMGYSQQIAREDAAGCPVDRLDEALETMRPAMQRPERQIVPPGQIGLADVKSQREEALDEAEEAKYFVKRDHLAALMAQSFSVHELPKAALQALFDALEENGVERLDAMAEVIKEAEFLRKFHEHEHERVKEERR